MLTVCQTAKSGGQNERLVHLLLRAAYRVGKTISNIFELSKEELAAQFRASVIQVINELKLQEA